MSDDILSRFHVYYPGCEELGKKIEVEIIKRFKEQEERQKPLAKSQQKKQKKQKKHDASY